MFESQIPKRVTLRKLKLENRRSDVAKNYTQGNALLLLKQIVLNFFKVK